MNPQQSPYPLDITTPEEWDDWQYGSPPDDVLIEVILLIPESTPSPRRLCILHCELSIDSAFLS